MSRAGERVFPVTHEPAPPPRYGTKGPYHYLSDPRAVKNDGVLPTPATQRSVRRKKSRSCCGSCCRCFLLTLVAILVILGAASLVIWLVLHPKVPKYTVQDVVISGLGAEPLPSPNLVYDFLFRVEANNPNKKIGIFYDDIQIELWYQQLRIGNQSVPGFYQGHRNITVLPVKVSNSYPLDSAHFTTLGQDLADNRLPLRTDVSVKARVKIGSWKSFPFRVKARCDLVVAPPADPQGAKLISKSCRVRR